MILVAKCITNLSSCDAIENGEAGLQRVTETLFFAGEHVAHEVVVGHDIGVGVAHHRDCGVRRPRGAATAGALSRGVAVARSDTHTPREPNGSLRGGRGAGAAQLR